MARTFVLAAALAAGTMLGCGGGVVGDDNHLGEDNDGDGDGDDSDRPGRPDGGPAELCGAVAPAAPLGGANGVSTAYWPSISVGADRNPVLTFSESGNEYAQRWDGAAWQPMGAAIEGIPGSSWQGPSSVTTKGDRIVVAWAESTPSGARAYAAEWNGSSWAMLGGAIGGTPAYEVVVVIGADDAPIVAWSGYDDDNMTLRAARWNGSAWQAFGSVQDTNPEDETFELGPSMVVGQDGAIYLAWFEPSGSGTDYIRVRTWSGTDWAPVGTGVLEAVASQGSHAVLPALVVDSAGRLVVGWSENNPTLNVFVSRWSGSAWESLGTDLNAVTGNTPAFIGGIAVDSEDHPIVGWVEPTSPGGDQRMHVYRHDGSSFRSISGTGLGEDTAFDPTVAVDECDRIFAAWTAYDGVNQQVFVHQLVAP